jgi:integrase
VCRGYLDERSAYREMATVIAEVEAEQQIAPTKREARFEDAVEAWFAHLEFEKRAKPSTLTGYRNLLAPPRPGERGQRGARIMREFAGRKLRSISTQDIQRFLSGIDREDVSARTVNIHRQLLHSIFEHARRADVFALRDNPVAGTRKRPEEGARSIETFEPEELRAIAEAARSSLHRTRPDHRYSEETNAEWQRINEQDAALFIVAACTGLRLGEPAPSLSPSRQPRNCKDCGSGRGSRATLTSSSADRTAPRSTRSAVRSRFIRAQEQAGVRVRRFHDLRHTFGSLAIQEFDVVAVKDMMGHSKLTTTERCLHSKPRPGDAAKLTSVFAQAVA